MLVVLASALLSVEIHNGFWLSLVAQHDVGAQASLEITVAVYVFSIFSILWQSFF